MIYRRLLPFIRRPSATFVGANVNSSTGTRLAAYHIQNCWLQPKKHFSFLVSAKNFEFYSLRPQSTFQEEQLVLDIDSEDDFDEHVLHSNKPVIASFYADWCGPCQNLAPRLAAKVVGQQGKILLAKINIEEGATLAEQYGISAVPTIVCFRHGEEVHRFEGDVDDHYLDEIMSSVMLKEEGLDKNPGGRIVPDEGEKENR